MSRTFLFSYSARPIIHWRLYETMERRGFNYQTLAASSGVTARTIYSLVHGDIVYPRLDTAIHIARALGVSLDYLYPIESEQLKTPI